MKGMNGRQGKFVIICYSVFKDGEREHVCMLTWTDLWRADAKERAKIQEFLVMMGFKVKKE
jgi:hypothetical protein